MSRPATHDILFEPVRIGPVTAPNRFWNAPHANGMGYTWPRHDAAYRGTRAEGGWGVVATGECMIHETSDHMSSPHNRLWSDADIPAMAAVADSVHAHGSLFAVELAHAGRTAANRLTRDGPIAPSLLPYPGYGPYWAREMSVSDIAAFRRWHRDAACRAREAGADIVYVYCAHDLSLLQQFLLPRYNRRTDGYGGPLANRMRLLREVLEDTKEAVGDTCAVALRFAVDELMGEDGMRHDHEAPQIVEALADLPDVWDVNISDWTNDSQTSRFAEEGFQEPYTAFVKALTDRPVVSVGRYTSPDRMASLVRRGHLDFIGAARPAISDPFLPTKIREGRTDEIRECIGCNMCTTNVYLGAPIRCTQNPSVGSEWSRGWHPEIMPPKQGDGAVLVVGAGPAGLECALSLAKQGHEVMLAEAADTLGGRVTREARLPGLAAWGRVVDHREHLLGTMANVQIFRGHALAADEVLELGVPRVLLAEGARWLADGFGRTALGPIPGADRFACGPEDVMDALIAGEPLPFTGGPVVVWDDEHHYMGTVIAEAYARSGATVTLATPAGDPAVWAKNTLEWPHILGRLAELSIAVEPVSRIASLDEGGVTLRRGLSRGDKRIDGARAVLVTMRAPTTALYDALHAEREAFADAGITLLERVGECLSPGPIAAAVHDGRRAALALSGAANAQVEPIGTFDRTRVPFLEVAE